MMWRTRTIISLLLVLVFVWKEVIHLKDILVSNSSSLTIPPVLRSKMIRGDVKPSTTEKQNSTNNNETSLLNAVKSQNMELIKSILKNNPTTNVNAEDELGFTPLIEATVVENMDIIKLLIEAGADVQPKPGFRHTPLRIACLMGNVDCIQLYLKLGADPNARSEGDRTPLMGVCYLRPNVDERKSVLAMRALLADERVDPTVVNSFGETALDLCRRRGYEESAGLLLEAIASWKNSQNMMKKGGTQDY